MKTFLDRYSFVLWMILAFVYVGHVIESKREVVQGVWLPILLSALYFLTFWLCWKLLRWSHPIYLVLQLVVHRKLRDRFSASRQGSRQWSEIATADVSWPFYRIIFGFFLSIPASVFLMRFFFENGHLAWGMVSLIWPLVTIGLVRKACFEYCVRNISAEADVANR